MLKHVQTGRMASMAAAALLAMTAANAAVLSNSSFMFELPPLAFYGTLTGDHLCYAPGGGEDVCIQGAALGGFASPSWIHLPDDTRINSAEVGLSGQIIQPGWAQGAVAMVGQIVATEASRSTETGTFETELIQLSLQGGSPLGPIMIRESPTLVSSGRITYSARSGGQFMVDSFFDVFTELSFDGGKVWYPSTESARFELASPIPEPASLALMAVGLAFSLALVRRRRSGQFVT